MSRSTFRYLVTFWFLAAGLGLYFEVIRTLEAALSPQPEPGFMVVFFCLLYVLVGIAVTVGLWRFDRWSRPTALGLTAVSVLALFMESGYQPNVISAVMYEVAALLNGAMLAAAYWSPVRANFERQS